MEVSGSAVNGDGDGRDIALRSPQGKRLTVANAKLTSTESLIGACDTIYALSSGAGRAGIAVVRVSGPSSGPTLMRLSGRKLPIPRFATQARLAHPRTRESLDDALVIWFPGPASYTGEDVAEFHVHGGLAVIDGVLGALAEETGMRLAEPGEFTRRAFDNGRLDLTACEGVADLVSAHTAAQRRQALRQMDGALARLYENWRDRLISVLARLEADMEFPDDDLSSAGGTREFGDITAIQREMAAHLADAGRGERLRDGIAVAIVGAPNAGKSSLLNCLARRDAAIVSSTAGTTRDVVEVQLDLAGYPVVLADTAGLRLAGNDIEAEGVRRSLERARNADIRLTLFDACRWPDVDAQTRDLVDNRALVVLNKCDLCRPPADAAIGGVRAHPVSALTGDGIDALLQSIKTEVASGFGSREAPMLTRARHREALQESAANLARAKVAELPELRAEDVRLSVRAVGRITGRVDVEDILDALFSEFCVGK